MNLRQVAYFQAVVRCKSFTLAAEECYISQSAISQQIRALETELGVRLLCRQNRSFALTEAGKHFYRHSLVLLADWEQLCRETRRIAQNDVASLTVGILASYDGGELSRAVSLFSKQFSDVALHVISGSHEDLYDALRQGRADLVLSDQRRAFSDEYENHILEEADCYIAVAAHNPLAKLPAVEVQDLRHLPCILIASPAQRNEESRYYREILGFKSDLIFAETMQEARVLAISNRGVLPLEGMQKYSDRDSVLEIVQLLRQGRAIKRKYCLFWSKHNQSPWIVPFAEIIKSFFA